MSTRQTLIRKQVVPRARTDELMKSIESSKNVFFSLKYKLIPFVDKDILYGEITKQRKKTCRSSKASHSH